MKKAIFLCMLLGVIGLIPAIPTFAITYGSGTYGSCQYSTCSISISSSGTVALNVTPTSSGACTTQSDTVSVFTDDPNGFTLSLANTNTNTALIYGSTSIGASSASQTSPAALLPNSWGYRSDGVGGFGAGPTTAQTNVGLNPILFAGVPASNAGANTIVTTSSAADPAVNTPVWYSVCANTNLASGVYTSQVTYTAITN